MYMCTRVGILVPACAFVDDVHVTIYRVMVCNIRQKFKVHTNVCMCLYSEFVTQMYTKCMYMCTCMCVYMYKNQCMYMYIYMYKGMCH